MTATRAAPAALMLAATFALAGDDARKPDAAAAAVERYLADCGAFGFSGAVLAAKDGEVLVETAYGFADRGKGVANTTASRFEIASASKQFTAAAVLKLVAAGKLRLDDAARKYLPEMPEKDAGVTVSHLLHHASGFPRMGPSGGGPDLGGAVSAYTRAGRTAEPGKRFEYWNGGYALLAGIVERASGVAFADFCRKELVAPAGLASTGFCGDAAGADDARGYQGDKDCGAATSHSFGWEYRGMGGVVTTVGDLFKWDRALRGDAVLPKAMRDAMFAQGLGDYACGWNVVANPVGRVEEHGGTVTGFETEMIRLVDDDACVFVLANRRDVGRQVRYTVASMLLGNGFTLGRAALPPTPPATVDVPADVVAKIAGRYVAGSAGALMVRAEGRAIVVGAEGQEAVDMICGLAPDGARHREARALAARIVADVGKGDVALLSEKVVDAFWSKTWPDQVQRVIWPARVEKLGPLTSCEEIGARGEGRTGARVWVRLHHEKGDAAAEVVLDGGRLSVLDFEGRSRPASASYRMTSGGRFVCYDFGRPVPPTVEFGDDGALRVLVPGGNPLEATRAK